MSGLKLENEYRNLMKDIVTKGQDLRKLSWTRTFFCRMDRRLFLVTKESKTQ